MGISVLRGVGWVPQKSAGFVQRPQHKSTPDPVAAPKNIPFGTIFIEFGDTKNARLAPKSRKKLIGALSCMHKGKMHSIPLGPSEKNSFCAKAQRRREYVRSLGKKTPFLAFPEAKKGVVNYARLRKAAHWPNNNANPSGLSDKKVYCVERRDMCDP